MTNVKSKPFVHLHLHTKYSLLDGACHPEAVMEFAASHDMPAVAITDHGGLFGVIDFYEKAVARGIRPVIGGELYVTRGARWDRKGGPSQTVYHLVLLAENAVGYDNLARLSSLGYLEGFYYKPRVDKELLARHARGLIALSACLQGEVAARLLSEGESAAIRAIHEYQEIFGKDNFFLEVQHHGIPEQARYNAALPVLSQRTGSPLVATNDVHYLLREHAAAHDVLLCLQTQTVLSDPNRMRCPTPEFYMKTQSEMEQALRDFPDALDRTVDIAARCTVEIDFSRLHFPSFRPPNGISPKDYLYTLGLEGIRQRYGIPDPPHPQNEREQRVWNRFRSEMDIIERSGFVNYFLVVWDFVRFAREKRIPVGPGRGSGGGSVVAYVLGITAIDPLRYGLLFERFLNLERISPPDFDIDFCQARRGEVIEYVREKYGKENVAQIVTFASLGARNVIRDVGRVLEIPYSRCDQLAKWVPEGPDVTLRTALRDNPELDQAYRTDADCRRILDYGFVLEGLYRNLGTHAAGVVIGERPLIDIVPLARGKEGEVITQYAMEAIGKLGLLKMDFLGLKTLTVIQETLDLVRATRGETPNVEQPTFDDPATFALLNRGDTIGVFQLESSGMRDLIRRVRIDRIEDLIAIIALFRPGPMTMLDEYVNRKLGRTHVEYPHPLLEPVLEETFGVMIYQEQVLQAAHILAGYSLAEADILRRAIGKKDPTEMERQRATFLTGCLRLHGIRTAAAEEIFTTIERFAGYGFNKSHSTAYAIVAYQTAYLKANYPAEFMAALLSSEIGKSEKLALFASEAEAMGLQILPPDVNASGVRFVPGNRSLRFGLAGIKGVGTAAAETIVQEREAHGPYRSFTDFCVRLDSQVINKKVLEALVRAGAFDALDSNRARLFAGIDAVLAYAATVHRDRRSGQISLFEELSHSDRPAPYDDLPDVPPWPESEQLAGEKERLGIYLSGHPLCRYKTLLERYHLASMAAIVRLPDGAPARLGGIIAQVIPKVVRQTREPMAILTLDNLDGSIETVVWPDVYARHRDILHPNTAVLVCGEFSRRNEKPNLIAQAIYPLSDAPHHLAARLSIHATIAQLEENKLDRLRNILRRYPGRTPVTVCLLFPTGEKVFLETDLAFHVVASPELIAEIEHLLGEGSVYVAIKAPGTPPATRTRNAARVKGP